MRIILNSFELISLMAFTRDLVALAAPFIGAPYAVGSPSEGAPFWLVNPPYTCPSFDEVQKEGVNCVGVVNLIRLQCGRQPLFNPAEHFEKEGKLIPFSPTDIPLFALLARKYRSSEDPGHYAIYMGDNNILHSYVRVEPGVSYEETCAGDDVLLPGVVIEPLYHSQSWFDTNTTTGTYTHICKVEDWL